MTPVDASNTPDKVKYTFSLKNIKGKPGYAQNKLKVGDYVRNADKRNIFSKGYTSNWNREFLKVNEVLKTQPTTYKIEDIKGEIIEGKYYEQELLKSEFDFESNNKVLESLNIREPASRITFGCKPCLIISPGLSLSLIISLNISLIISLSPIISLRLSLIINLII